MPVRELLVQREGDALYLLSPDVGVFTCALPDGALVSAGMRAGVLQALGRSQVLVVPAGVAGRIRSQRPEAVLHPVGYGARLYELALLEARQESQAPSEVRGGALLLRAPYSGRFWQRPAPSDPPFAREGDTLVEGQPFGLLEVMKTFTHLAYRAGGELPPRARIVRILVPDGGEVKSDGGLMELEPA